MVKRKKQKWSGLTGNNLLYTKLVHLRHRKNFVLTPLECCILLDLLPRPLTWPSNTKEVFK